MNTKTEFNNELLEFKKYVRVFYGMDSKLYPMNASDEEIDGACELYRYSCDTQDSVICWGDGDSLDRERVKDVLFAMGHDWKLKPRTLKNIHREWNI